jgi:peptide/nickel transport system permease protein
LKNRPRAGNVGTTVLAYLVRRTLWSVVLVFALAAITFVIFFVIPSNQIANVRHRESTTSINESVGLHGPIWLQYVRFVWHLFHGSLGYSWRSGHQTVASMVFNAAPVTASLVIGGVVMWLLIALPIGILSAMRPRSLLDRGATIFVLIGISVHPIWLGLILLWIFSYKLHAFPLGLYCDVINPSSGAPCGGVVQWFWHLILPWFTFASLYAALYMRMVRANVMEALNEDYVRTARAKGASELRVVSHHALRNALLPIATMLGMDIGIAMGGTLFVENVFSLPGLGKMLSRGLQTYDLPVLVGVVSFMTFCIVIINLVIDVCYRLCDPRVRARSSIDDEEQVVPRLREPVRAPAPAASPIR